MTHPKGTTHAKARFIRVKSVDVAERVIEGTASSPATDRVGDIVEPLGIQYNLPVPLLLDHDHKSAVGTVEWLNATKTGIRFRARIAKVEEPGAAKDLVDYAWDLVRSGLRKTVSIGFRILESQPMREGGYRYTKWELFELSLVAVPANADAQIETFKSFGAAQVEPGASPLTAQQMFDVVSITQRIAAIDKNLRDAAQADIFDGNGKVDEVKLVHLTKIQSELEAEREGLLEQELRIKYSTPKAVEKSRFGAPEAKAAKPSAPAVWKRVDESAGDENSRATARGTNILIDMLERQGFDPNHQISARNAAKLVGLICGHSMLNQERIETLEAKLAEHEAKGIKYEGVWQRSAEYRRGSVVTDSGSAWHAIKDLSPGSRPGSDNGWQLMVKAGRDARVT